MTVVLCFTGGPKDGRWRRMSSADVPRDRPVVVRQGRGYYTSVVPWEGLESHIEVLWFYGTPELHEAMKAEG